MAKSNEERVGRRVGRKARDPEQTMTRRDLALELQKKIGDDSSLAEVTKYVHAILECMSDAMLEGRYIEFRDFGTFEIVERNERLGRNPRRPQDTYVIPKRKMVKFNPARRIVDELQKSV